MKKYLFLFVTAVSLALFPGRAHAQRYLPGMKGVELRGGFANGSKSPLNYYTGFAVSGYTPKANRWVIGAEYLMKNYGYRDASVPRAQFTAEGGYYLKFLSDPTKTVFLSVGGSALAQNSVFHIPAALLHWISPGLTQSGYLSVRVKIKDYDTMLSIMNRNLSKNSVPAS